MKHLDIDKEGHTLLVAFEQDELIHLAAAMTHLKDDPAIHNSAQSKIVKELQKVIRDRYFDN